MKATIKIFRASAPIIGTLRKNRLQQDIIGVDVFLMVSTCCISIPLRIIHVIRNYVPLLSR